MYPNALVGIDLSPASTAVLTCLPQLKNVLPPRSGQPLRP